MRLSLALLLLGLLASSALGVQKVGCSAAPPQPCRSKAAAGLGWLPAPPPPPLAPSSAGRPRAPLPRRRASCSSAGLCAAACASLALRTLCCAQIAIRAGAAAAPPPSPTPTRPPQADEEKARGMAGWATDKAEELAGRVKSAIGSGPCRWGVVCGVTARGVVGAWAGAGQLRRQRPPAARLLAGGPQASQLHAAELPMGLLSSVSFSRIQAGAAAPARMR